MKHGLWRHIAYDGSFEYRYYRRGVLNGFSLSFYPSGAMSGRGWYLECNKHGEWLTLYENGKLKERGHYKKDFKVGEWLQFNKKG